MTHVTAAARAATTHEAATAQARTAARTDGASFATVHTAAVKDAEGTGTTTASTSASAAPKGERTEKVTGHHYVEIVAGPRNGMFLNDTGNSRDGEAFVIVKRSGREFHIYGTGDDRKVYEVGRERDATPATGSTGSTASGTTGATG